VLKIKAQAFRSSSSSIWHWSSVFNKHSVSLYGDVV